MNEKLRKMVQDHVISEVVMGKRIDRKTNRNLLLEIGYPDHMAVFLSHFYRDDYDDEVASPAPYVRCFHRLEKRRLDNDPYVAEIFKNSSEVVDYMEELRDFAGTDSLSYAKDTTNAFTKLARIGQKA